MASLILVLREGSLKQVLISLDESTEQDELLARRGTILNDLLEGRTAVEAEHGARRARPGRTRRWRSPAGSASASCARSRSSTPPRSRSCSRDGLLNVMAAPEFAQSEKLRRVFAALENRAYLAEPHRRRRGVGNACACSSASENPAEDMADVSLVLASYGHPGRGVGVVGVLGPTRMAYPQAIGTVRFVSGLMNELIDHLYA